MYRYIQLTKIFQSVNQLKNLYVGQITMQINVPNYLEKAQKKEMKKKRKKKRKKRKIAHCY